MAGGEFIRSSKVCGFERLIVLQVRPGADLLAATEKWIKMHGIRSGGFVSGLGALKKTVLRLVVGGNDLRRGGAES